MDFEQVKPLVPPEYVYVALDKELERHHKILAGFHKDSEQYKNARESIFLMQKLFFEKIGYKYLTDTIKIKDLTR